MAAGAEYARRAVAHWNVRASLAAAHIHGAGPDAYACRAARTRQRRGAQVQFSFVWLGQVWFGLSHVRWRAAAAAAGDEQANKSQLATAATRATRRDIITRTLVQTMCGGGSTCRRPDATNDFLAPSLRADETAMILNASARSINLPPSPLAGLTNARHTPRRRGGGGGQVAGAANFTARRLPLRAPPPSPQNRNVPYARHLATGIFTAPSLLLKPLPAHSLASRG